MNRYEMMFRSGVMTEWRPVRRWESRRMINEALRGVRPDDWMDTALLIARVVIATALAAANVVLFVGYWL